MDKRYFHTVKYYETDKMGVTHHSNYLRFMEEARIDFLDKIGYGYKRMEDEGLISPVVAVDVNYKKPTTFADIIEIDVQLAEVGSAKLKFCYTMSCNGETVCTATSTHCFVDKSGRPVSLKRVNAQLYDMFCALVQKI